VCEAGSSWHDDGTAMRYRCAPVMMMRVIQEKKGVGKVERANIYII
jgi:hypothetical protein